MLLRLLQLSPRHREVSELVARDRQVALPLGIGGIRLGETLGDFLPGGEVLLRLLQLSPRHREVSELVARDRQVVLPRRFISRLRRQSRQPICDRRQRQKNQIEPSENTNPIELFVKHWIHEIIPETSLLIFRNQGGRMDQQG